MLLVPAMTAMPAGHIPSFGDDGAGGQNATYIEAEVQYGRPPSGKLGKDSSGCTWTPAEETLTLAGNQVVERVVDGVTQHLFIKACPTYNQGVWIGQHSPATLGSVAASKVTKLLAAPAVMTAPPVDTGIVKIGMWFWTDPAQYEPHSVTAWVPTPAGVVWSTTTARPVRLEYEPGEPDAATATCAGPGEVWQPADGDETPSACMYTYQHSSEITATDTFPARLSIVWEITWTSNAGGGSLPAQRTTTTQDVTVGEIQAIVTG